MAGVMAILVEVFCLIQDEASVLINAFAHRVMKLHRDLTCERIHRKPCNNDNCDQQSIQKKEIQKFNKRESPERREIEPIKEEFQYSLSMPIRVWLLPFTQVSTNKILIIPLGPV